MRLFLILYYQVFLEQFCRRILHENFDNFTTKEHNIIDGPSIIAGAKTDTIT